MSHNLLPLLALCLTCSRLLANPIVIDWPVLRSSLDDSVAVVEEGGQFVCGGFTPGVFGNALVAGPDEDACVRLPVASANPGFQEESGILDFWFRLLEVGGNLPDAPAPALVMVSSGESRYGVSLGRDPETQGCGLIATAGHGFQCATVDVTAMTYEEVLGEGSLEDWHHVALFWCQWGIEEADNHVLALYVDGVLHPTVWHSEAGASFPPVVDGWLDVAVNDVPSGICVVDEARVYWYYPSDVITIAEIIAALRASADAEIPNHVGPAPEPRERFTLPQNEPNPFNPETEIRFTLARSEHVTLTVHDVNGRLVRTLLDGRQSAGEHVLPFDALALPSGIYFYRLKAGALQETRAMTLLQ